ncbi:MAG: type I DNA topoisomerase [Bacilli bacterium]|nr:type I DNA topoisomerase [Bacilli bacterium]
MKLVIVESPTKCNTIQRYLGDNYIVKASLGHVRDLATSGKGGLGVDVENNFTPTYIINKDKKGVVAELKEISKKADEVILATDPDREGEAIAWHLATVLGLNVENNKRLEFHEITRDSISEAMENPRTIDLKLVSSQETRRILDRIIGFKLSALINRKIHSKSAGRVQSATLKIINDHEYEIESFVPEEYWEINVQALFGKEETDIKFVNDFNGEKEVKNEEQASKIISSLEDKVTISAIEKTTRVAESKLPFTTSSLQQEAFTRLKFSTAKTSSVSQSLYEGILVNGEHVGLITYIRTDSTRLSPVYIARAEKYIEEAYGKQYIGSVKKSKNSALAQDAHEAIRPTSNHRTPESVRQFLTPDQYNLYKLIYIRALSSLMKPKKEEVLTITLSSGGNVFKHEYVRTIFPGYEIINKYDASKEDVFPEYNIGDSFDIAHKEMVQKFTTPPSRYSEAKIVKLMEELGIGRPSTYASTIATLKKRHYVTEEKGILLITEQGRKTAHILDKYFPSIVNAKYTAKMEEELDKIEEGDVTSLKILQDFYGPFIKMIDSGYEKMYVDEVEPTGDLCPKCGSPLIYKLGKNGKFVACSNYPKCNYVQKEQKELVYTGGTCPDCGSPLVEREKNGKKFIACSNYPKCKYIEKKEVEVKFIKKCPECEDGQLIKKRGKFGYFLGCTNYPKCQHIEQIKKKRAHK